MADGGWSDPKVALTVYAHAMRRDDTENEALRELWRARVSAVMAMTPSPHRLPPKWTARRERPLWERASGDGPYWFRSAERADPSSSCVGIASGLPGSAICEAMVGWPDGVPGPTSRLV
jgi:hypothetical protein